jgi:hypothetical protein
VVGYIVNCFCLRFNRGVACVVFNFIRKEPNYYTGKEKDIYLKEFNFEPWQASCNLLI